MLILSLDTTTPAGSAALVEDGRVVGEQPGDARRTHAERLPAELLDLLARHGRTLAEVDLFAVAAGPGAFTGLRIGIATIQGLALAARRKVVAVSALEALAWAVAPGVDAGAREGLAIVSVMDAQRGEVYAAAYAAPGDAAAWRQAHEAGALPELVAPTVGLPGEVFASWTLAGGTPPLAVGEGARAHRAVLERVWPGATVAEPVPLIAGAIGLLAATRAAAAIRPHDVRPLYVRRPDAERERDRRAAR